MSLFYALLARSLGTRHSLDSTLASFLTLPRRARAAQAWQPPDPALSRPLRPYILIPHCNVLPLTPPDPASSWVGVPLTQCARETGDHCGRLAITYKYTVHSKIRVVHVALDVGDSESWRKFVAKSGRDPLRNKQSILFIFIEDTSR